MLDSNVYKKKRYIHFDHRIDIEKVESYVTNGKKIAKHSFLPFIHYVSTFDRYIGQPNTEINGRPIKDKNRDIMYAGHLDNYIYKYYAEELNEKYNSFTRNNCIDDCSIAYRSNKKGKSNINFAAEVINKIVDFDDVYILIGDFTKFFDKINHRILKENLLKVLQVNRLEDDWYNVYKSITKFGYYEKEFLIEKFGTDRQIKCNNKSSYFDYMNEFRTFQRMYRCKKNDENFGIPQGTAISAVYANVYAINFDIEINKISSQYGGIYRRYSDDFILVIPKRIGNKVISQEEFRKLELLVRDISNSNKIELHEGKTEKLEYKNGEIHSLDTSKKHRLDYLGFVFDGKTVKMRGKSPYKFYREANKLIIKANKVKKEKNLDKVPYRKRIYGFYTDLGINRGTYGNFITYVVRAQSKFDKLSPRTDNIMMKQIRNRKKIVRKLDDK
ncbi:RNA-directed DNA polymerase [Ornithinibacillus scapharcae]|uniref:RNA-directed DNA polymerase n=1 Tax=Ornithinibacillus scapharcae TaxID=1147159 RepID=UPI000225BDCA|nr:RNA-directed DNA polymerase [Ornithinibacillus scapharcae]